MHTEQHAKSRETAIEVRVTRPANRSVERPEGQNGSEAGLWVVDQAADYLQVSPGAIYKMTGRKARLRIPHIRVGGRLRFRQADLDRWLTLLTESNLDVLERVRKHASR
jgi:excisionase family DNA binding protein